MIKIQTSKPQTYKQTTFYQGNLKNQMYNLAYGSKDLESMVLEQAQI